LAAIDRRAAAAKSVHANDVDKTIDGTGYNRGMEVVARERRRFFERPEEPRAMRITARDVALLGNISRFRLVSASQLAALDGGSAQNVSRALLALWENGYIERPEAQVASRILYEGSRPTIYGLTRRGAALLREHGFDVRRRLLDGIDKERGAGWRFVEHTVSIAEFMIRLELAVRGRDDLRILERGEILEDAPKSKCDRLVRVEASIRVGGALRKNAVVPDALFGLGFGDAKENYFMLEIDRGEMPVERYANANRTYFAKKMLTYYEANRQRRHVHDLGIENFRVLTVTTSAARVEKMLDALGTITNGRGSNVFLFTDQAGLTASNPIDLEWVSGKREGVRLID
jgi:DNA-binding transcriptional ArsR family regulator